MFNYKSKEEREQDFEDYQLKVFPFGSEHKDFVEKQLSDKFEKYNSDLLLYYYIVAKQDLLDNRKNNGLKTALNTLGKIKPKLSEEDKIKLIKLIEIDINSETLSAFKYNVNMEI